MDNPTSTYKSQDELLHELEELRHQLYDANETIEAIRTGQIDAIVVQGKQGAELYTLKSADQTYRVFIEKMTEGAVTLSSQGIVLYCNSQFATMVDRPLSQLIGLPFDQFIAEESGTHYFDLFQQCWQKDCNGEVLLTSGRKQTPVKLSLTTLDLNEGISLSIILTDLTAQKATQQLLRDKNDELETINQSLERSNNDLQQFASVASHDLQEPLRKIQVFAGLLKEKEIELPGESKTYLQKIIQSSERMRNLIVDVLNYSRLSSTNAEISCVDLNEIVNELREDFELVIKEKKARLITSKLPCLQVNRGQIRQVFQNIISNALKFSKATSEPEIVISSRVLKDKSFDSTLKENGPYCLITIADNGIGFDENYAKEIFQLFERLHTKDKYEGTGIGLSIAKKIIEKHNGSITAESEIGKGSTFKFILPCANQYKTEARS